MRIWVLFFAVIAKFWEHDDQSTTQSNGTKESGEVEEVKFLKSGSCAAVRIRSFVVCRMSEPQMFMWTACCEGLVIDIHD